MSYSFFLGLRFQTRKFTDFQYWAVALHLHKFGYFYTREGRALLSAIAKSINSSRYSTNPDGPVIQPSLRLIQKLLATLPLVELTPQMTHLMLSKAYTVAKGKSEYIVYVYHYGALLLGSPFTTYADAHEAIGVARSSRAIGRTIDTGKLYLGRYRFYSRPI